MSHKAPYNHEEGLHSDEELELVHVDEDDEDYDEEDYEEEDNEDVSIAVPLSKSVTLTRTRDEVNKTEPLRKSVKLTRTRAELDPPTSSSNKQNSIESPKTNPAMSQRQESAPLTVMKGSGSLPTTQEMNHSYEREWISEPEYRYSRKRKQLMLSCLINVFMIIIVIILATVFVSRRGSTAASSSQVATDNNVPTTPPVPKPTFKPIKERPEDPDGHPVAPPNMIVDRPTNFDPDAEYEDPPPPPPPTNPQPTPKPPTLPPPTAPPPTAPPPTAPPPTAPPPTAPPPTQPVIVVPETPPTLEPTITVTLPPHVPAPVPLASEGYVLAFEEVHKTSKWVLENGSILATFGPQIKTVGIAQEDKDTYDCESNPTLESCYEFHRGLDLHADSGSTIYSAYEGKVVAILDTPNEEGLVLEHIFPEEVIFHIDKPGTTTWYTLYFHAANWNVQLDDIVAAGTPLAVMDGEHLHYEVRIGTPCDLQDSIENPATSCNTLGFDPHVHPLMSLPDSGVGQHSIALEILQELDTDASGDGIVRVSTPATNPNMNKFTIAIINVQTGATRASFKIDINRRIGFDATSLDALDTIDRSNPFLQPLPFDATQDAAWQIDIIIPGHWICPKSAEEEIVLTAEDVWGRFKFVAFGLGSEYGANNDCPIDPNA